MTSSKQSLFLSSIWVVGKVITFLAFVLPICTSASGFMYISRTKEFFLVLAGCVCLATLSRKNFLTWTGITVLLGLSTLLHADSEFALAYLFTFSSLVSLFFAIQQHFTIEDQKNVIRATSIAVFVLGIDSIGHATGFAPLSAVFADLFGGTVKLDTFSLYEVEGINRAFSFMGNPNRLGAYLLISIWFLLFGTRTDKPWLKFYAISILVGIAGMFLTYSRGAYFGFCFSLFVFFVLEAKNGRLNRRVIATSSVFLIIGSIIMLPRLASSMDMDSSQVTDRIAIWSGAWSAFLAKPLVGWGVGGFGPAFSLSAPVSWWGDALTPKRATLDAHNDFLTFLVEFGMIGGVIILAGLYFLARRLFANSRNKMDSAIITFFAAGGFASLFSTVLRVPAIALLLIFVYYLIRPVLLGDQLGRMFPAYRMIASLSLFFLLGSTYLSDAYYREAFVVAKKEPDQAALWFKVSTDLTPSYPSNRFLDATILKPDFDNLEALSEDYPGYRDVEGLLAETYLKRSEAPKAHKWFSKAYQVKPTTHKQKRLISSHIRLQKYPEARALIDDLQTKIDKDDKYFPGIRAVLDLREGRFGDAAINFSESLRMTDSNEDRWKLGLSLLMDKQLDVGWQVMCQAGLLGKNYPISSSTLNLTKRIIGSLTNRYPGDVVISVARWGILLHHGRQAALNTLPDPLSARDIPWLSELILRAQNPSDTATLKAIGMRLKNEGEELQYIRCIALKKLGVVRYDSNPWKEILRIQRKFPQNTQINNIMNEYNISPYPENEHKLMTEFSSHLSGAIEVAGFRNPKLQRTQSNFDRKDSDTHITLVFRVLQSVPGENVLMVKNILHGEITLTPHSFPQGIDAGVEIMIDFEKTEGEFEITHMVRSDQTLTDFGKSQRKVRFSITSS